MTLIRDDPLASQPIPGLLLSYAIPSIISMLIGAMYNVIDQVFIGHALGYDGVAATSVAWIFITVADAVALLFGQGCAAFISIRLGEGNRDAANKAFCCAIAALAAASVAFAAAGLLFLDPLLRLFGASESLMDYCRAYSGILLAGMPIYMSRMVLTFGIRVDGSPRFAMVSMMSGALLNIALDPLFITAFRMGIRGAAAATVLSQAIALALSVGYFVRHSRLLTFRLRDMKRGFSTLRGILKLGLPSFSQQLAGAASLTVLNNSLRYYGALTVYGSGIPLSSVGIVQKVSGIMLNIMLGIAIGAQPILGFNYGAGNISRVKRTYLFSILCSSLVAAACWAGLMLFPRQLLLLFGDDSELFLEFGTFAFRSYLAAMLFAGIYTATIQYFAAVDQAEKTLVMSLIRYLVFQLGFLVLLARLFGLSGVLWSGCAADVASAAVAVVLFRRELGRLNGLEREALQS